MNNTKLIKVRIGGYLRLLPEEKLPQVQRKAQEMIESYTKLGVPREKVEQMYKIEIVKDKK